MKRSHVLLLSSAIFLLWFACKPVAPVVSDTYTINGKMDGLKDPVIYLSYSKGDSSIIDTAVVKDGSFTFTGRVKEPVKAQIFLKDYAGYLSLYLEDTIIGIAGKADSMKDAYITGGQVQRDAAALNEQKKRINAKGNALYEVYKLAKNKNDQPGMDSLTAIFDMLAEQEATINKAFITANPHSFISLSSLHTMTYSGTYNEIHDLFIKLDTTLQNSGAGKKLAAKLVIMEKVAIGKPAIEFTQNDVNGKPVKLSDFKGKYVLLDFWASWCGPCRGENPSVVKAYNKFKNKNFTILSVSLDESESAWKAAIKEDGLTWAQVSSLKGWKNEVSKEYGVEGIPTNFLLSPEGTILAKNLRGLALEKKLAAIVK
ncbi:peroxiredoxin [Chitinophaga niastensis]|uniref:Peroxiredoxin n=1 Tax=Chitinophaga niastensis TaxID=536980 RepID=A0A2P8HPE4_CHINA|nr:TlpA disulfide reductase family protein [Chitinophaga niastensis]PSL48089.1 peroxiredoxin [Chitinophaga niastensis]